MCRRGDRRTARRVFRLCSSRYFLPRWRVVLSLSALASNKVAGLGGKILEAAIGDGLDSNVTTNGRHLVGLHVGVAGIDVGADREIDRRCRRGTFLACRARWSVR